MDLAEFLLARINEDEAEANRLQGMYEHAGYKLARGGATFDLHTAGDAWNPARVLAECEAKRAIVEHVTGSAIEADEYDLPTQRTDALHTLHLLALPYASHESYREEWKP